MGRERKGTSPVSRPAFFFLPGGEAVNTKQRVQEQTGRLCRLEYLTIVIG